MAIQDSNYDGTFGIVVNGTMSTSGASFTRLSNSNGNDNSQLLVNAGGKLTASNSNFDWDNVVLANSSVQLISTDITNNIFGLTAASTVLSVPITDVPFLTNNKSFEDVDINAGSLNGGQSVALNLMGTATTVNLRYVFPGAFEVKPNATLSIGDGVSALIRYAQTITVDSGGTLSFGAAAVAIQDSNYDGTFGIVVNGTMSTSGASFTRLSNSNGNDNSQLLVNAGGKLTASNSNFDWDNVVLANGSVQLISTDITNNIFGLTAASTVLSVPITDVPFLTNNQSFEDVDINAGSLNGGQSVALNLMGTATTVNLRYVFPGAFEVKPNATLSIGDGVSALIRYAQTITVDSGGTLSFGAAAVAIQDSNYDGTFGIVVNGTMSASGASFTRLSNSNGNDNSQLLVNAGGKLTASNSNFDWDNVVLANGSVQLISTDITNNIFGLTAASTVLSVPITDIPFLANNQSFEDIDIDAGSLSGNQTVTLNQMGTATTVNLRYVFPGAFTVQAGATLNIGAGVNVLIRDGQTITDNGTLNITGANSIAVEDGSTSTEGIVVNGKLTISNTSFTQSGGANVNDHSAILANSLAVLNISSTTLAWDTVTLTASSVDTFQYVNFSCQLAINSGASFTIAQNDLSNVGANGVIASGPSTDHINLKNNYWGTDSTQIPSLIHDHTDDPTLPTVDYSPVAPRPTQTIASPKNVLFSTTDQNVTLVANVTSPSGTVNEGKVTFTVLSGESKDAPVSNGVATTSYDLPAGTAVGTYTIQAVYTDSAGNYSGSTDNTNQQLTISSAATTTAANPESVTFSSGSQSVPLSATVSSSGGIVGVGSVTFTIFSNNNTVIASAGPVNVSGGVATTTCTLQAGQAGDTYKIEADYTGTTQFANSTDSNHSLTISAAATTTTASNVSETYSTASQSVTLNATVISSAGTVNAGTLTFTILGTSIPVSVSNGFASTSYTLQASTSGGTYTISAVYSGTNNFAGSSDTNHSLTVSAASTTTATTNLTIAYSAASQTVPLNATVTSQAGTVKEGTVTFTILSNNTVIASAGPINVTNGSVSATCTLPAGLAPNAYSIIAAYKDTANFGDSSDPVHTLTIIPASTATVSVSLDSNSNSGAPDHPGFTNDTTPTFDVNVNQAGTITIDFDGNSSHDQTQSVSASGTYQFTAPTLANGTYTVTATFNAGLAGTPQSSTGYTIDTVPPQITALTPSGTYNNSVSQALVTFSEPVDLNTFSPSAITLAGPAGAISVNQPQLVSGNTYSISFPTQTAQGTYNLAIASSVTDFAANEMGQKFSTSFTIALPDLTVTTTSAPTAASEGASFPVGWEVVNLSPTNATGGTWNDAVYVSSKSVLDNTAIRLTSLPGPTSPLAPQANYSRSTSVFIPGNLASGNYYLLFVTNDNGGQTETNAGNNVLADPITVSAPDLQVTGVSGPATGLTGQTVLLSWPDENTGSVPATGPWVDNVFAATDSQGHNQTLLGSFTFDGTLAAGASVQRTQQIILPQTPGTNWFGVTANATQTVAENFSNDTTISTSSINITAVPLPDLVVTSITPPANGVFSGNSVPVSFIVKNVGKAGTTASTWQDWVILSQDSTLAQTYSGQLNPTGPGGDQTLNNQPVILGFANPSYLGVGQSYQQTVNVPLPLNAEGTWYVYVVPDGTGFHHPFAMPEVSRADKLAMSAAFSVTLSTPPDLAVSVVQAPRRFFPASPSRSAGR